MTTDNSREWGKRFDDVWALNNPEHPRIAKREAVKRFIHQELQKARHDWLREEIVKLDGTKREMFVEGPGMTYLNVAIPPYNQAIQTIIDRYLLELDQPL
jgi:hypothetical protein